MTDIINLDDYREAELLANINVYRQHDGAILLAPTYMVPSEIEAHDCIADRFERIAEWLRNGEGSLSEQAKALT